VSAIWKSRTLRRKNKLTVLEGTEAIVAAAGSGLFIKSIYYMQRHDLDELPSSILSAAGTTYHHIQGAYVKLVSQIGLTSSVFGI
jgi:hypothetical protein